MLNQAVIMGRLTAAPEIRQTTSGVTVAKFTVAVDRPYRKDVENQPADFIRCIAWRATAEFIERNFTKGNLIIISGRIQTGSYKDNNGVTHYTTDIVVSDVNFSGEKRQQQTQAQQPQQQEQAQPQAQNQPQQTQGLDLNEFEEILSDGEVPF